MSAVVKADVRIEQLDATLPDRAALSSDLFSQITFDYGGRYAGSAPSAAREELLPAAPISTLRENFEATSVRVMINGQPFDVAVPNETFNESREDQKAIAAEIGGRMPTRAENRAVAEYLLDREAGYLLAQEKAGAMTNEQRALLELHREKWKEDRAAEARAEEAGAITDKEAALLAVYREKWVRDEQGGLDVAGVRVRGYVSDNYHVPPYLGALVVCSSAESK